jgi:hypothetical protein
MSLKGHFFLYSSYFVKVKSDTKLFQPCPMSPVEIHIQTNSLLSSLLPTLFLSCRKTCLPTIPSKGTSPVTTVTPFKSEGRQAPQIQMLPDNHSILLRGRKPTLGPRASGGSGGKRRNIALKSSPAKPRYTPGASFQASVRPVTRSSTPHP